MSELPPIEDRMPGCEWVLIIKYGDPYTNIAGRSITMIKLS